MTETKELRYDAPPKPIIDDAQELKPDIAEFDEGEKAWALARSLGLKVGDTLREHGNGSYFTVNPRMKLRGHAPEEYKIEVMHFKALCTPKMISMMSEAIKNKRDDDKFYGKFTTRLDKRVAFLKVQMANTDLKFIARTHEKNAIAYAAVKYFDQPYGSVVAGLHNCVYFLLSKDEGRNKGANEFVLAWFDKPIPNSQEWNEESDGEYRVLTDSEADQACEDYLDDSRDCWVEAAKANQTDMGFEDWKEMVRDNDGRGNCLNHYDGGEEYEDIDGTTYYIYRTN